MLLFGLRFVFQSLLVTGMLVRFAVCNERNAQWYTAREFRSKLPASIWPNGKMFGPSDWRKCHRTKEIGGADFRMHRVRNTFSASGTETKIWPFRVKFERLADQKEQIPNM